MRHQLHVSRLLEPLEDIAGEAAIIALRDERLLARNHKEFDLVHRAEHGDRHAAHLLAIDLRHDREDEVGIEEAVGILQAATRRAMDGLGLGYAAAEVLSAQLAALAERAPAPGAA